MRKATDETVTLVIVQKTTSRLSVLDKYKQKTKRSRITGKGFFGRGIFAEHWNSPCALNWKRKTSYYLWMTQL